jgi:hypothetical protein
MPGAREFLGFSLCAVAIGLAACTSAAPGAGRGGSAPTTSAQTATTGTTGTTTTIGATTTTGSTGGTGTTGAAGSGVTTWAGSPVGPSAIPLGDGKVTTSPRVGYIYSCTNQFRGGGARGSGPWIDSTTGVWNESAKIHVEDSVSWPDASHAFTLSGADRILKTNDLPSGAVTGNFPISSSDPAYQYDTNPNHIQAQSFDWTVPADPTAAASPGCLGLGPIGVSIDGVVFFDALDAAGRDAGAHEIQDSCGGHPQGAGIYHYHFYSPCLATAASEKAGSSTLVGYALDGYGIYVERDSHGNLPTDADLDVCHGRTSRILWDGKKVVMYHYDVTVEYPYTLGCFHGTAVNSHA